jgi:anti-sigma B factor antagonist
MRFTIAAKDQGTHIAIEGQLDAVSVSDLRAELDKLVETRPKSVEVDLSQLRLIDSSGIGALVSLYKRVRQKGGNVVITGVRDQPLAIFQLLQLDRFMLRPEKKSSPRASR